MDCVAFSESYSEKNPKCIEVKFTNFLVIKITTKRMAFENAYESTLIF